MARLLITKNTNPHSNLALEDTLFETVREPTLYLWQNRHTVVIGRNQNAWRECDTALLESEGGTLARRTSGGGAVYHDMGNLNFSFVMPREMYDLERQLSCVLEAVRGLGINAAFSGRNDLIADERKFSGNAFRFSATAGLHHGTLLTDTDFGQMGRYLRVSPQKMKAKGVESVRSRVVNLNELAPVRVRDVCESMCVAFANMYGGTNVPEEFDDVYEEKRAIFASWEWNYGQTPAFDISLSKQFGFGGITFGLSVERGIVKFAKVYTDVMDVDMAGILEEMVIGRELSRISMAIAEINTCTALEIAAWLRGIGY